MTFDNFDTRLPHLTQEQRLNVEAAYRQALTYAQEPEDWLVLEGAHGCGKTHLAAAIANRRLAAGERPLFLVVPDLLDYLRYAMDRDSRTNFYEVFDRVKNAPMLILDDLGAQSDVPWVRDRLFQLVNHRYAARLPTVFTVSRDSLNRLEERFLSRLYDPNVSTEVPIISPAYRVDQAGPTSPSRRAAARRLERESGHGISWGRNQAVRAPRAAGRTPLTQRPKHRTTTPCSTRVYTPRSGPAFTVRHTSSSASRSAPFSHSPSSGSRREGPRYLGRYLAAGAGRGAPLGSTLATSLGLM
jgi:hypothetical protein